MLKKTIQFYFLLGLVALVSGCSTAVKIAQEDWQARQDVRNRTELSQFNARTLPIENNTVALAQQEVVASTEVMPAPLAVSAFTPTSSAESVKAAARIAEIVANSEGKTEKQIKQEVKQALKSIQQELRQQAVQAEKKQPPFAVASFVLGIVGLVFIWSTIGLISGILATIFGAIALSKASKSGQKKGLAIAGLIMGIVTIAVYLFVFLLLLALLA